MKKVLSLVVIALALIIAGCAGGGEEKSEKETPTPSPVKTPTPAPEPEKTAEPSQTEKSPGEPGNGLKTLYDLYMNKKMLHGTASMTVEGKTQTFEFWYYFDADNRELLIRMDAREGEEMGSMILRQKYEGNTLTTVMYSKGGEGMPQMEGCDWMEFKQTVTVSPSDYEDLKDEPVSESFEATMMRQGNVVENYRIEYVDYDPSIFQPDGNVCSIGSYMGRG